MKYWITTFQGTGVALFAGSVIATPTASWGVLWGVWFVLIGFVFSILHGGDK